MLAPIDVAIEAAMHHACVTAETCCKELLSRELTEKEKERLEPLLGTLRKHILEAFRDPVCITLEGVEYPPEGPLVQEEVELRQECVLPDAACLASPKFPSFSVPFRAELRAMEDSLCRKALDEAVKEEPKAALVDVDYKALELRTVFESLDGLPLRVGGPLTPGVDENGVVVLRDERGVARVFMGAEDWEELKNYKEKK